MSRSPVRRPLLLVHLHGSLAASRSYQAVAERFGVTKRAVTNLAKRENWQKRLLQVEAEARERLDQKKVNAQEAVKDRHLRALRMVLVFSIFTFALKVEELQKLYTAKNCRNTNFFALIALWDREVDYKFKERGDTHSEQEGGNGS